MLAFSQFVDVDVFCLLQIHRRKVRAWQMISALSRFVDLDIVEQVSSTLHTAIYVSNFYLETY